MVSLFSVLCFLPSQYVNGERKLFPPSFSWEPKSSGHPMQFELHPDSGCGRNEECVPAARCTLDPAGKASLRICTTPFKTNGVCCFTTENPSSRVRKRSLEFDLEHVSNNAILEGRKVYAKKLQDVNRNHKVMTASGGKHEQPFHHILQAAHPETDQDQHEIYEHVFAARNFAEATNMSVQERQMDLFNELPHHRRKRCVLTMSCNPHARYRSFDGSCNNLHPERSGWGSSGYPFEKLLPPAYEDGVWAPRLHSVSGRLLTSPRMISATLLHDLDRPDKHLNLLMMQFGQFIAHDFSRSSSIKIGKEDVECCTKDGAHVLQGDQSHFGCLPIKVSPHDPFYSKFGVRCLNFVRLELARNGHCKLGYAKQVSKVTHFVDASTVYGSNEELAVALRTFQKGQLRNSFPAGIQFPPLNRNPNVCEPWAKVCFEAGDDRVNQIISLVQVQTLFLREHNRVAAVLSQVNPHWDDETLYQEARKVVVAEVQKVFYNEYLPLVVGWDKAKQYGLLDNVRGHTNSYSPNVKPVALSEVSAAAFRFGHSTVAGHFRVQHRHAPVENIPIHKAMNDPSRLLDSTSFDDYLYSLGNQAQQKMDQSVTLGLAGFLFAGKERFGSDLPALNIQRGRDHALRPYNDYRVWVGLPKVHSFHELGHVGAQLAQVYESPDDIDLWVGGLLEPAQGKGLVGETFGHLIAEQFARLKYGDRFYYTNSPHSNPGAFTPQQLEQLQRVTLASIICANVDRRFDFYQAPRAFQKASEHNVPLPCDKFHDLHFGAWRH